MKILSLIAICVFCVVAFFCGAAALSEGYNPIKPDIDTRFGPNYSEDNFNKITVGMDTTEVLKLIGPPLEKLPTYAPFKPMWAYSGDGKCKWQNFGWLARGIVVGPNGKVKEIKKSVRYD
jgi:hypothetical protein